jgi:hypothetical protein
VTSEPEPFDPAIACLEVHGCPMTDPCNLRCHERWLNDQMQPNDAWADKENAEAWKRFYAENPGAEEATKAACVFVAQVEEPHPLGCSCGRCDADGFMDGSHAGSPREAEATTSRLAAEPSRLPAQCARELDVEPTGAPDEDVCLGDVDPATGRCRTCGTGYAAEAAP